MSTKHGQGQKTAAPLGMRPAVWAAGGLMWVLVLGCGLLLWWRTPQVDADGNSALASATSGSVENEDEPPAPIQITLPVNSASADNGQVIDISQLMGQSKPVETSDLWSPEGVEDFAFTNCDGSTVTKADLIGRPWAICFVFTKCLGPCPTVTKQFRDLLSRLKDDDIRLVTLTVDPARDTPEVLANYAKLNGADLKKWHFLTGDQAEIYGLIHRSFRMPVQEVTGPDRQEGFEVIHSTNVMLVDATGVVRGKFNAAKDAEMADLRRELQALAAANVVESGSPVGDTPVADGRP